jgi:hypothetical protein
MEPSYPIFFPTYTPVLDGYDRDWWWFDLEIQVDDQGPFSTRSEAVADWAFESMLASVLSESKFMDSVAASLLIDAGLVYACGQILDEGFQAVLDLQTVAEKDNDSNI